MLNSQFIYRTFKLFFYLKYDKNYLIETEYSIVDGIFRIIQQTNENYG